MGIISNPHPLLFKLSQQTVFHTHVKQQEFSSDISINMTGEKSGPLWLEANYKLHDDNPMLFIFYLDMSYSAYTNLEMKKKKSKREGQVNELGYTARLTHNGKSQGARVRLSSLSYIWL